MYVLYILEEVGDIYIQCVLYFCLKFIELPARGIEDQHFLSSYAVSSTARFEPSSPLLIRNPPSSL